MIGINPAVLVPLAVVPRVLDAPTRFATVAADWIEDRDAESAE